MAIALLPIMMLMVLQKSESFGLGVSTIFPGKPLLICNCILPGRWWNKWYLIRISYTSEKVDALPTVGPLAMALISSPGTSLIISEKSLAPLQYLTNWPPLIEERCLRTVL